MIRRSASAILICVLVASSAAAQSYTFTLLAGPSGGMGADDGIGSSARFANPSAVATDRSGNVYVADTLNYSVRKITPAGVVSTVAGPLDPVDSMFGVAVDGDGNVYVAENNSDVIREIFPTGGVTTFAGSGEPGAADGTGNAARFNGPRGLAADTSGNIYVADTLNHIIRKVTPAGVVTTLAGSAGLSGHLDGTGDAARFDAPFGVATDSAGNVYVADSANNTIRKITPAGTVTTLAGEPERSGSTDGTGSDAHFFFPLAVATDGAGNVYVADTGSHTIRKVTPSGVVTTLAGLATQPGSDDGRGSDARFLDPTGLATDNSGNVYVADSGNNTIRKVTPDGTVTTLAGAPKLAGSADGTAAAARFNGPSGVAVDSKGNVFVTDTFNHTIRRISPNSVVSTFAGLAGQSGSDDGSGNTARFNSPRGLAIDNLDNIYVADTGNHTIRKVTLNGVVTTFAGSAGIPGDVDGPGGSARFHNPQAVAADQYGDVFVADTYNDKIREISPAGVVVTLAGSARFNGPAGIAADSRGNVYVASTGDNIIEKIAPDGSVTTVGGLCSPDPGDRCGYQRFNVPHGLATDRSDNVYVADTWNRAIRKITPDGSMTVVAGSAQPGSSDGTGTAARFNFPYGVAVDAGGSIYVTSGNIDRPGETSFGENTVRIGRPALADMATIDSTTVLVGTLCQFDTFPRGGTTWQWSIIRQPSRSSATLSSASIRNPIFIPDVADVYEFRLVASDGRNTSITTVSLTAVLPRRRAVRH